MRDVLIKLLLFTIFIVVGFLNACLDGDNFFPRLITYLLGGLYFGVITIVVLIMLGLVVVV